MKKIALIIMSLILSIGLIGCANEGNDSAVENTVETSTITEDNSEVGENLVIKSLNSSEELEDVEVPFNPEKIVVLDMAALDIIEFLELDEKVVGVAQTSIEYLKEISEQEGVENVGTLKAPDLEAIMSLQPDVILMGGRAGEFYDQLSQIAPVVRLRANAEIGVVESTKENAKIIASIFGLEEKIDEKIFEYEDRISNISEIATGKEAIVGLVTNGGFNILGSNARASLISNEMGFTNLGDNSELGESSTHGNEASFEFIVDQNPEYVFVLDRDSAIKTEGAKLAEEIMDNELIHKTSAYENDNLVILENPGVWYTAEGGVTALDIMISDIEKAIK